MYDSFVRQLNYYGFRKALRNTNRYVVMDRSIESPDDFRFLNRYIPSHALRCRRGVNIERCLCSTLLDGVTSRVI